MISQIEMQVREKISQQPRLVSIVECQNCRKRWTAVRPEDTRVYELECPLCGKIGYAREKGGSSNDESDGD